ncbi:hypothetical protein [Absidia glauca]|uniref:Uncharacterized protein n=1 Tax=Absidia glauca TaxID=4829 RepID=A0A163ITE3_ABSGL|nr:hypothetical protein [Absidia glauca]
MLHRHSSMMFFTDDDLTTDPAFLVSKSSSMYHPQLDQYTPPLSQKQIDRLSNQYNSTNAIQQLLTCSSVTLNLLAQSNDRSAERPSPLQLKPNTAVFNQIDEDRLPISPPLSPLSTSTRLSTCSFTSSKRASSLIASSLHLSPSHSTPIPPSSIKQQKQPSILYDDDISCSTLSQYPIIITHIQRTSRMKLRSFLGHSILLNRTIRLDTQLYTKDPRFYQAKDEVTGQAKLVLKLTIIKSSSQTVLQPTLTPFGIHFVNTAILPASSMSKYASVPDALVLEALYAWLAHSHLPHLSHACHIMRDGMKLYIVFDPSTL